jgi:hypothetical protein
MSERVTDFCVMTSSFTCFLLNPKLTVVLVRTVKYEERIRIRKTRDKRLRKVKLTLYQAVESHRVVRHRGSHIF